MGFWGARRGLSVAARYRLAKPRALLPNNARSLASRVLLFLWCSTPLVAVHSLSVFAAPSFTPNPPRPNTHTRIPRLSLAFAIPPHPFLAFFLRAAGSCY